MEQENFHKSLDINDKHALKLFYMTFYPSLCRFANKYLKTQEVSHDIVQDAFLYLWNKRQDFTTENQAKSYLYSFVRDRSLNYLRDKDVRQKIVNEKIESETFFRDNLIEEETYQIISHAISDLSHQSQRVIEFSLDGLKNREIADKLGVSINTVKTIKLRAFASLRDELKENIFILLMLKAAKL
jgi:RNA polymerase sigma-70 factor (family 1)